MVCRCSCYPNSNILCCWAAVCLYHIQHTLRCNTRAISHRGIVFLWCILLSVCNTQCLCHTLCVYVRFFSKILYLEVHVLLKTFLQLRTTALGLASSFSRIGGALAPFIILLVDISFHITFPYISPHPLHLSSSSFIYLHLFYFSWFPQITLLSHFSLPHQSNDIAITVLPYLFHYAFPLT